VSGRLPRECPSAGQSLTKILKPIFFDRLKIAVARVDIPAITRDFAHSGLAEFASMQLAFEYRGFFATVAGA